jgi:type VI secretion system secreted protein VgrG
MNASISRRIQLHSVLGADQLLIKDAIVREHLGTLGAIDLDLLSPNESLAMDDLLGQGISIELTLENDQPRFFHGLVAEFAQSGRLGRYARYSVRVVPWLWLLTRTSDCRIFQQQSIPDIIKSLFRAHGTSDFEDSLSGSYAPREYCVQYMETDFNFVSRLMEEEGIYYFFRHEQDKDTLVLCDSASAHSTIPGFESMPYYPPSENAVRPQDHVNAWQLSHSMQSGKLAHTDFDFTKPRTSLLSQSATVGSYPKSDEALFEYPGGYLTVSDGSRYAQRRLESIQHQHEHMRGSGNVRGLAVGALFSLEGYPREDQNQEYLVISAVHHLAGTDYESGVSHEASDVTVHFEVIPSQQPYRSPLTSRKSRVAGPQTAIVVGPASEEIYTDQYGRVKVQFHWDRYGTRDENSSCWIRVSQLWAGKNWGAMHIPRIGQEVIVSFLEGDPDRPIITGRVYNASEMPPYDLPANQTQSGIKSRSSMGGSPANYNEICFEDKMGSEVLTIHAEKDQTNSIENNETLTVGADRTKTVGHDETTTVQNNLTETVNNNVVRTVKVNETDSIGGNVVRTVSGDVTHTTSGNETKTISKNETRTTTGNYSKQLKGDHTDAVAGKRSTQIGGTETLKVSGNCEIVFGAALKHSTSSTEDWVVGGARTLSVTGNDSQSFGAALKIAVTGNTTLSANGSISITSAQQLTLGVGGSTIVITPSGITVTASGQVKIVGATVEHNTS